jgi:dephospho-CoA kinase
MRVVGLTGGIASGKSTVARILAELGARIVDADQVAREIVEPGQPAYDEIVAAFGVKILHPDGSINRKLLGAQVFADAEQRKRLNAITHPRIAAATQQKLMALGASGARLAVYEAALLVENGIHRGLGGLIVVYCDEKEQIARVMRRDNLSQEEAVRRIHAQAPLSDKLAVATWAIDTNGPVEDTRRQVEKVWSQIITEALNG